MYNKILLIVPPFYRLLGSRNNWMHIGLQYVASVLSKNGYSVKIYNTDADPNIPVKNYKSFFEENLDYKIENTDLWDEIEQTIRDYDPDLVGITLSIVTKRMAYRIARLTKKINPDIPVIIGGPEVTLRPLESLVNNDIDYAIFGEGEYSFLEFVRGMDVSTINGLVWRMGDGSIKVNNTRVALTDLDGLPFPDPELELIPVDTKDNFIVIQTVRGCPYDCFFCSSPRIWGRTLRRRSVKSVVQEIVFRKEKHGVEHFYFCDDTINMDREYLRDLCNELMSMNITFSCEARLNLVDETTLRLMKQAGCTRIKVGVESGSNRILKLMNKHITTEEIKIAVKKIKDANIPITVYVMIGLPSETRQEILETLDLCKELDPDWVSLSVATPWYGTDMYDMVVKEMGIEVNDETLFHQSKSIINDNVTEEVLNKFFKLNTEKERGTK